MLSYMLLALAALIFVGYLVIVFRQRKFRNDRFLEKKIDYSWWESKSYLGIFGFTKRILESAGYNGHWSKFVINTVVGSLIFGLLAAAMFNSFLTLILCSFIAAMVAYHPKIEKYNKKLQQHDDDFVALLQAFIIYYKDFGNISRALSLLAEDVDNNLKPSLEILANSLNSGEPIESCLKEFAVNSGNRWAKPFNTLILSSYYNGGYIVEACESLMKRIRNSSQFYEKRKAALSQTVMTLYIGIFSQPVLLILAGFITPDYYSILFNSNFGVSIINTVLLINIVTYIIIRTVQRRSITGAS